MSIKFRFKTGYGLRGPNVDWEFVPKQWSSAGKGSTTCSNFVDSWNHKSIRVL
uniref:Uncharacterized protein n=1 Tax=Anguilla anguilla TaxID=7936 RepID=A0A0E9PGP7_ANGAN